MFTGIITHTGSFRAYAQGKSQICIQAPLLADRLNLGDSLAVNGVCLSMIRREREELCFNLSSETLKKTTLGSLKKGELLNLELPLTLSSPLGGHLVTGHIDGIGKVNRVIPKSGGKRFLVSFPPELRPYFVPKGSVALDGVSLTTAALTRSTLEVEAIPITLAQSTLGSWKPGRTVNLECDIIGKYVYNWTVKS